ncbi:hypothetical protein Esti_001452 [Eimeria stiedai]
MSWRLVRLSTGETWAVPPLPPAPLPPPCVSCGARLPSCCETFRATHGSGDPSSWGAFPQGVPPSWGPPEGPSFAVGRGTDCAVRIESPTCSRRHLYLRVLPPPLKDTLLSVEQLSEHLALGGAPQGGPQGGPPSPEGVEEAGRLVRFPRRKAGRFFVRNASPNDTLINGVPSTAVLQQQQQQRQQQQQQQHEEPVDEQQQQQQAAWLLHAGYVEVYPGDALTIAGDAALSLLVSFSPTILSLTSNPDRQQQQQRQEEEAGGGRLLQSVQMSMSVVEGLYLLVPRFHPVCCCLLSPPSPPPSSSLLLCLLANKPLLLLSALLAASQPAAHSSSSSSTSSTSSNTRGVYLAARLSHAAAVRLQQRSSSTARGRLDPTGPLGAPPDWFEVAQEDRTDWRQLVLHLAASRAPDSSNSNSNSISSSSNGGPLQEECLLAALKRMSPAGVCVSPSSAVDVTAPTDRRRLFAGCVSLTLSAAAFSRLSPIFRRVPPPLLLLLLLLLLLCVMLLLLLWLWFICRAGKGLSLCLLGLHASLDAAAEEALESSPSLYPPVPVMPSSAAAAAATAAVAAALRSLLNGAVKCLTCFLFVGLSEDQLEGPRRRALLRVLQIVIAALQQQQQQQQQQQNQHQQPAREGLVIGAVRLVVTRERQAVLSVLKGCLYTPGCLCAFADERLQAMLQEAAELVQQQQQQQQQADEEEEETQQFCSVPASDCVVETPGGCATPKGRRPGAPDFSPPKAGGPQAVGCLGPLKSSSGFGEARGKGSSQGAPKCTLKKASAAARFAAVREAIELASQPLAGSNPTNNHPQVVEEPSKTQHQQQQQQKGEAQDRRGMQQRAPKQHHQHEQQHRQQQRQQQRHPHALLPASTAAQGGGWQRKAKPLPEGTFCLFENNTKIAKCLRPTCSSLLFSKENRKKFRKDVGQLPAWQRSLGGPPQTVPASSGEEEGPLGDPLKAGCSARGPPTKSLLRVIRGTQEDANDTSHNLNQDGEALTGVTHFASVQQQHQHQQQKMSAVVYLEDEEDENTDTSQRAEPTPAAAAAAAAAPKASVSPSKLQTGTGYSSVETAEAARLWGGGVSLTTRARLQRWTKNTS